ncbi:motility associated factor glycosyltransferase family protein [Thalassolituus sp. LLYu03]|uniref:motility associated factor glycosyltransferase family protein n=1 Tax=Thalassolituus sp. LLYu03 TaxID=3421656 RepID=UPI003D2912C9
MTISAETLQQEMQQLRNKNEAFFKRTEPSIYNLIHDKKLSNCDLQIVKHPEHLEVDVTEQGSYRYHSQGRYYCREEANKFLTQMSPGSLLPPFIATDANIFSFDRVGSRHFKELSETIQKKIDPYQNIPMPEFYPLLVITGVGLGFHIENVVQQRDIGSLIIYEHKLDRFLTSLYCIDWEAIYQRFNPNKGTSIQLIIADTDDQHILKGILWNELIKYCPHFPFATLFYNHLMDPVNQKVIDTIRADIINYLQQWGHYDDEINQYNNARQNLLHDARAFFPSRFRLNPNISIAIVGAGPSLDNRIQYLKKYRDQLLIISCGTSIGTMFSYGIKPDFHVELESDYVVYEALSKSTTEEFRKDIILLASAQVNPRALNLFERSCIYFKDSTALSELFVDNHRDIISNTTPTCTNAGVAIACHLGVKNIFLFGTDFGFIDKNAHHASGSIYFKDKSEISAVLSDANDFNIEKTIKTTDVHGQLIDTKPMYFVSQRMVEECIKFNHLKGIKVFNCSDGASIKNTQWLPLDMMDAALSRISNEIQPSSIANDIYNLSVPFEKETINKKSDTLIEFVDYVFEILQRKIVKDLSLKNVSGSIFMMNNLISRHIHEKKGYLYYFIRGQIWLFLSMYFTYALSSRSEEELAFVVNKCEDWLKEHHRRLREEMEFILYHDMSLDDDPWVNMTVENK